MTEFKFSVNLLFCAQTQTVIRYARLYAMLRECVYFMTKKIQPNVLDATDGFQKQFFTIVIVG